MGKHEREQAEATERVIVALLQDCGVPEEVQAKAYNDIARKLAKQLRIDFSDIQNVRHIGNSYDSIGDLAIRTPSEKEVYIEVKGLC